jgi:hypothetical protein
MFEIFSQNDSILLAMQKKYLKIVNSLMISNDVLIRLDHRLAKVGIQREVNSNGTTGTIN